jgi:diphosphate-dependent phosphofructokinase
MEGFPERLTPLTLDSVVIPEGLIECIPELKLLLHELDVVYKEAKANGEPITGVRTLISLPSHPVQRTLKQSLTLWSLALLESLPEYIQVQLMLQRKDGHQVHLSQAETERLLAHFVDVELNYRKKKGTYRGTFSVVSSFIGYQARGAAPSNFDIKYAYNLGHVAAILAANGLSGYMATISNLKAGAEQWKPGGVPISALMTTRAGTGKPSVPHAKIDLQSVSYRKFAENKHLWSVQDLYENPGPLQFHGPTADEITHTLQLESFDYLTRIQSLYRALQDITVQCRPGCSSTVLQIATTNLTALTDILQLVHEAEASHPATGLRK